MHHDETGRAYYRPPKKNSNWPMWMIFGLFIIGLIAFLVSGEFTTTSPGPGRTITQPPPVPLSPPCERLSIGGRYGLSRQTPIHNECGGQTAGQPSPPPTYLRSETQIVILRDKWLGKVRWYKVEVFVNRGRTPGGKGWVCAEDLRGQSLPRF